MSKTIWSRRPPCELDPEHERLSALQVLNELGTAKIVPSLLSLLEPVQPEPIRMAAVRGLVRFDHPSITTKVLALYRPMPASLKSAATRVAIQPDRFGVGIPRSGGFGPCSGAGSTDGTGPAHRRAFLERVGCARPQAVGQCRSGNRGRKAGRHATFQ